MTTPSGTWRAPKFLRSISFGVPKKQALDQARRQQLISESLWPTTLDRESYKAAAILRSFCREGAYHDETRYSTTKVEPRPSQPKKESKKIPVEIIRKAKGLVVFNILRAGLCENGAGGSGVIVSRQADGSWSSPAAIKVSTPEVGVVLGVDIFDSVLVLNNEQSVEAFKRGFCLVGRDNYAVTGPLDVGWFLEADAHARNAPIYSYFRSQQYYADVPAEDFAFNARDDENNSFYSPQMLSLSDILSGRARSPPASINGFMECLKLAQGDADINEAVLNKQPPPSDFTMVEEGQAFAIPDVEDPDQYGYAALEKHGIIIVDAATKSPVAADEFEFKPSVKSPAFEKYHRKGDTSSISGRSSWRASTLGSVNHHDGASVRSRNSYHSSAPTSPLPLPSPGFASQMQIQMEDNEPDSEPTLNVGDDGRLYTNGDTVAEDETGQQSTALKSASPSPQRLSRSTMDDVSRSNSGKLKAEKDTPHPLRISTISTNGVEQALSVPKRASRISVRPVEIEQTDDDQPEGELDQTSPTKTIRASLEGEDESDDNFEDLDEDFEIHDASASQPTAITQSGATAVSLSQAKVVTVPKAITPSLPVRNSARMTMLSRPASTELPQGDENLPPKHSWESEPQASKEMDDSADFQDVDLDNQEPVSPVSFLHDHNDDQHSEPKSTSPTGPGSAPPSGIANSLVGMRMGLGTRSPERSPER